MEALADELIAVVTMLDKCKLKLIAHNWCFESSKILLTNNLYFLQYFVGNHFVYKDQNICSELCIIFSVGGTVLAGGAAAFGAGVLTNNQGLRDAGLTSVLAGGALKGVSTLLGKKWIVSGRIADQSCYNRLCIK